MTLETGSPIPFVASHLYLPASERATESNTRFPSSTLIGFESSDDHEIVGKGKPAALHGRDTLSPIPTDTSDGSTVSFAGSVSEKQHSRSGINWTDLTFDVQLSGVHVRADAVRDQTGVVASI